MNLDSAIFYSNNIKKIIPFYKDILGLKLEYQQEDKFVSFVFPKGVRLGIKKKTEAREIPGAQTVFVSVDNIDELYNSLKEKNINIIKDITEQDWGKNFSILDLDKNKVQFVMRRHN